MAKTLSRDTTPEAEAVQIQALRRMPPWRKVRLVEESNRLTRALIEAGVRSRHPGASCEEVRHQVLIAFLGAELAAKVQARSRDGS
jgi:hypothetical protein